MGGQKGFFKPTSVGRIDVGVCRGLLYTWYEV